MTVEQASRPVLIIGGPTASGKSSLAVAVCRQLDGEIVNADCRQIYRGMDIGTAKPSPAERCAVPHHLYDTLEPEQSFSAAEFARLAGETIDSILARGRLPVVVGGTGLYLRALVDGLFEGPGRSAYHQRLERLEGRVGLEPLRRWLERVDPVWAARIQAGDRQRTLRGLDVYLKTRRPLSQWLAASPAGPRRLQRTLWLGVAWPRAELYARIERRVDAMLAEGLVEETEELARRPGFRSSNAARSVGYRQVLDVLDAAAPRHELAAAIKRASRQLAKRQLTWFRWQARPTWLEAGDAGLPVASAVEHVSAWLEPERDALRSAGRVVGGAA